MDRTGFSPAAVASKKRTTPAILNPWPLACESVARLDDKLDLFMKKIGLVVRSKNWVKTKDSVLRAYLDYCDWQIDEKTTFEYLTKQRQSRDVETFRKYTFQIRKFLRYCDVSWANHIDVPPMKDYTASKVSKDDIRNLISHFDTNTFSSRCKAIILLGATTGMRAFELYRLNDRAIDIDERRVIISADIAKTKKRRVAFFNMESQQALIDYFEVREDGYLFPPRTMRRLFVEAPLYVKDLRKFFSQEWDRHRGPTSIKKILMGHSLRGDVDLMHYNCQSEEDLKRIYDETNIKVFG